MHGWIEPGMAQLMMNTDTIPPLRNRLSSNEIELFKMLDAVAREFQIA
jgi:hypothetical protein